MALDGTYSGLKDSVADFLNRTDLTSAIPDFITLAEAQMARRFVSRSRQGMPIPRRLVKRSDASIALGDEYISVPSDFQGPLEFILTATPPIELDYIADANLQREKKLARWTGSPKWYTVVGGQMQLFPVADAAYSAELTYIARVAALSDAAPNWIITDYPDAYLYGALTASAPYLKDDPRVGTWGNLFSAAVDDICNSDPMPTNKVKLRVDTPISRQFLYGYNINNDASASDLLG